MWMLQRGNSGDGCVLASTLCEFTLRKGDLFVLSWENVRQVRRGSIYSELKMCGGGVRSILLVPLVHKSSKCIETIYIYVYGAGLFYVCCSNCVGVCGNVCCVAAVVKDSFFNLGVLKYSSNPCTQCVILLYLIDICFLPCICLWQISYTLVVNSVQLFYI